MRNRKATGRAMPLPAGLSIGLGVSVLITVLLLGLFTQMIASEAVGEEWIGWGALFTLPVASAAGALTAVLAVKRRWLWVALAAGGVYFIALLAVNSFVFGGAFSGVPTAALLILLGSTLVGLCGLKGTGGGRRRCKFRSR